MDTARVAASTTPDDLQRCRRWTDDLLTEPTALSVTYNLDGRDLRGIPADWRPQVSRRRIDACMDEVVFSGTDPDSGLELRVEVTLYRDFPVVEWVAWFRNGGDGPSPILQDILAVDASFDGAGPHLRHCNGDFCSETGYTWEGQALQTGDTAAFAPTGGRACDSAFPYYRLLFEDGGLSMAIGWPAQWAASFEGVEGGVRVRAGQQQTHLRLQPGERIRTPRITVLAWDGDAGRAVNLWRRWYLAHVLPRPDGQPLRPKLAFCGTDEGAEFTAATEANQLRYIDRARQLGIDFDVWWIDAGWYPCYDEQGERSWPMTGSWEPDPERFPNGMGAISERIAGDDASLLLWFEPERVRPGTRLDVEHADWLLRAEGAVDGCLDLGNPACREWLTDHVSRLIDDNGIGIYRQDHNFSPLAHWRENDDADRQGMHENLHVQGYLQYWDDLLARHRGLWIDSCASGGRRNDLETLRRSVPLHYSDYGYGEHRVKLAFHRTLYEWIPYFKEATVSWDLQGHGRYDDGVDSFSFHCGMAPMLFATLDIRRDDYDYPLAVSMIELWRRAAELILHGDFYPHTPDPRADDGWLAWQFDRPELGRGLVQAIRFADAPAKSHTVHLQGIDPEAAYHFENPETGATRDLSGQDLVAAGFRLKLPARSGAVWFYRRVA